MHFMVSISNWRFIQPQTLHHTIIVELPSFLTHAQYMRLSHGHNFTCFLPTDSKPLSHSGLTKDVVTNLTSIGLCFRVAPTFYYIGRNKGEKGKYSGSSSAVRIKFVTALQLI